MTLPELKEILKTLGLPVAYLQWAVGQVPELPYILYYSDEDNCFYADDVVFSEGYAVTVEVYSQSRDLELESRVKNLLKDHNISYESYGAFLKSEDMYLKAFEFDI